jgi:hypothetical protein
MNATRAILALVLLLSVGGARLAAQEPPTLDRVEELARLGRTEEARAVVGEWWRTAGPNASRRDTQRGLWLRGQLTPGAAQAALDFNRLVVEYPGGPFSDLALLRLAQASYAAGDSAAAAAQVERLLLEYPSSPIRSEAEAWLATAGPVPQAEEATAAPEDTLPAGGTGEFTVQLGAFSSVTRAEALLAQLSDAGFAGRLAQVSGSDLVRVRLGRFDSAEGAEAILWQVRDRGFTATVARDAHREELVVR